MSNKIETAAEIAERLVRCSVFCTPSRHDKHCAADLRPDVAAAIEEAERRGAEREREACATLAATIYPDSDWPIDANYAIRDRIARYIRARTEGETSE